jgi:acyl-CoA thioesterase I
MAGGIEALAPEESFMRWFCPRRFDASPCCGPPRSYGTSGGPVQAWVRIVALAFALLAGAPQPGWSADQPVRIVVLGDSLAAGLGLAVDAAFPAKLERALQSQGVNVKIDNAGVSGDTASNGLDRVDWSVADGTDAVIVELGANDALRGVDPKITHVALEGILLRLQARQLPVLLAGMQAPRNLGPAYAAAFDAIYPELAARHAVLLYPFFLDGVATDRKLNQGDGMHPNAAGVDVIVERITPKVKELVGQVQAGRK